MKTIVEQINKRLEDKKDKFNEIKYGRITFVIQDGIVLRRENLDTENYDDIKPEITD